MTQKHSGEGDNVAGDKIIHNYWNDVKKTLDEDQAKGLVLKAENGFATQMGSENLEEALSLYIPLLLKLLKTEKDDKEFVPGLLKSFDFEEHNGFLITSDGGSGKTTFLKKIAFEVTEIPNSEGKTKLMPIYIKLNSFDAADRGYSELCNIIGREIGIDGESFERLVLETSDKFVFLLDSFNEVNVNYQATCLNGIETLLSNTKHVCFVTSRPIKKLARLAESAKIRNYEVQPFSKKKIEQYLFSRGLEKLYYQLDDKILGLAGNPFILWALTKSCRGLSIQELPQNIGQLYFNFIDRHIFESRDSKFSFEYTYKEVKKVVLSKLSFLMTSKSITRVRYSYFEELAYNELEVIAVKYKRRRKVLPDDYTVDSFFEELLHTGIIKKSDGYLELMHQSVQEYFTAVAMMEMTIAECLELLPKLKARHIEFEGTYSPKYIAPDMGDFFVPTLMLVGLIDNPNELLCAIRTENSLIASKCLATSQNIVESTKDEFTKYWKSLLSKNNSQYKILGCLCVSNSKLADEEINALLLSLIKEKLIDEKIKKLSAKAIGSLGIKAEVEQLINLAINDSEELGECSWAEILKATNSSRVVMSLFEAFRINDNTRIVKEKIKHFISGIRTETLTGAFVNVNSQEVKILANESLNENFEYKHSNYYLNIIYAIRKELVLPEYLSFYVDRKDEREKIKEFIFLFEKDDLVVEVHKFLEGYHKHDRPRVEGALQELMVNYSKNYAGFISLGNVQETVKNINKEIRLNTEQVYGELKSKEEEEIIRLAESQEWVERIVAIRLLEEKDTNGRLSIYLKRFALVEYDSREFTELVKAIVDAENREEVIGFVIDKTQNVVPDKEIDCDLRIIEEGDYKQALLKLLAEHGVDLGREDGVLSIYKKKKEGLWHLESPNNKIFYSFEKIDNATLGVYNVRDTFKLIQLASALKEPILKEYLLSCTQKKEHLKIRVDAINALSNFNDFDCLNHICELLETEDRSDVVDAFIGIIKQSDSPNKSKPLLKIIKMIELEEEHLWDRGVYGGDSLFGSSGSPTWVERISDALNTVNSSSTIFDAINEVIDDFETKNLAVLARVLTQFNDARFTPNHIIETLLKNESTKVRREAIKLLAKSNSLSTDRKLLDMCFTSDSDEFRMHILRALKTRNNDEIIANLIQEVKEKEERINDVVYMLGELGDEAACEALSDLILSTTKDGEKILAVEALIKIGYFEEEGFFVEHLMPIVEARKNSDYVRSAANSLLKLKSGREMLYLPIERKNKIKDYSGVIEYIGPEEVFNPDDIDLFWSRGWAFFMDKQYDKALEDFSQVVNKYPNLGMGYFARSAALIKKAEFENALIDSEEANRLNPNDAGYQNNLGYIYLRLKKFERAKKTFLRALELDKNNLFVNFNLGGTLLMMDQVKEALEQYEKAISVYELSESNDEVDIDEIIQEMENVKLLNTISNDTKKKIDMILSKIRTIKMETLS